MAISSKTGNRILSNILKYDWPLPVFGISLNILNDWVYSEILNKYVFIQGSPLWVLTLLSVSLGRDRDLMFLLNAFLVRFTIPLLYNCTVHKDSLYFLNYSALPNSSWGANFSCVTSSPDHVFGHF